jgi:chloride channel 3/4/5
MLLLGYITRTQLAAAVAQARSTRYAKSTTLCRFTADAQDALHLDVIDMEPWVEVTPLTLSKKTSLEEVVQYFQRMGLRYLLLTDQGKLAGILTKHVRSFVWTEMSLMCRTGHPLPPAHRAGAI